MQRIGNGKTAPEKHASGRAGGLAEALVSLEAANPGIAVGIRMIGHDGRTRRLGNAAMNAVVSGGHVFDKSTVLAELANGQSYRHLALMVAEPAEGLTLQARVGLVTVGLDVLSRLDSAGAASAAA